MPSSLTSLSPEMKKLLGDFDDDSFNHGWEIGRHWTDNHAHSFTRVNDSRDALVRAIAKLEAK